MSQPSGSRFVFTAPFDLYAELQRLDRIAGSIGASTEIDSSYDDAARELVSKLRGTVTEGPDPIGGWVAADDVNRLVREIDVALNGADAAPQAALCDIAGQVCKVSREGGPILKRLGAPPKPAGAVPLLDRDAGGRIVREAWMRWALTQACPKPSWLVPYDDLPEADKEADRQIFEACAGGATAADVVPETWREFVTACANTGGGEVCGNQLSARAKSLLEALPKNPAADERGKCAHCGVLCSIGAFIPDGRWVCSADCHVLLSRAEGRGPVLKTPEGWQITRNEVGGIRVDGPDGEWLSIDESAPNMGRALMERRLLYGLAEALLTAAPAPQHAQANDWRQKAAEWLEQKALDQEQVNRDYPRHASAYKEWRDRPMILRMLAQDIVTAGDEQAMIKRNCRPPTWMFPDDDFPAPRSLQPGDGWDENVRYLLNRCKHTIRVREGGGAKDLLSSLIVTFTGMEQKIAAADSVDSKAAAEVIEVARDVAKRAGPDREQKLHESLAALDLSASAQQTPPTTQNGES